MKLSSTSQILKAELLGAKFDMFIGASGYESRARYALSVLDSNAIGTKLIFGFKDRLTRQREDNDLAFTRADAVIVPMSGDSVQGVSEEVRRRIEAHQGSKMQIFVDYSSMTRSWYAGIIDAIRGVESKERIECIFSYSPAEFSEPALPSANSIVGPIPGFSSLDVPEKPSALIIGLGYEQSRAFGLLEYVDPAVSFAFYTDPAFDNRFRDTVLANNSSLLAFMQRDGKDRIFKHPLHDLQRTADLLISLYTGLRDDHRVILAPLGVKPFALLCMLIAIQFRDLDVWRVSPGTKAPPHERKPLGPLLALAATFEPSPLV